jgi:hypothetical protein
VVGSPYVDSDINVTHSGNNICDNFIVYPQISALLPGKATDNFVVFSGWHTRKPFYTKSMENQSQRRVQPPVETTPPTIRSTFTAHQKRIAALCRVYDYLLRQAKSPTKKRRKNSEL